MKVLLKLTRMDRWVQLDLSLSDESLSEVHTSSRSFQILSITTGGLQKRLKGPDFEDFIQNYMLICI